MSQPTDTSRAAKVRLLLERVPPEQTQAEWTGFYAAKKAAVQSVTHSVIVFRLGHEWLALATNVFQEITERSSIHSLPHRRSETMLGLVRVRGELFICISLAAMLGIESQPAAEGQNRSVRFIVLAQSSHRFVFPADEVFGVHRITGELLPVPSTVAQSAATYTRGLFHWRDHTVGCLDEQLLFHTLNRSLA